MESTNKPLAMRRGLCPAVGRISLHGDDIVSIGRYVKILQFFDGKCLHLPFGLN